MAFIKVLAAWRRLKAGKSHTCARTSGSRQRHPSGRLSLLVAGAIGSVLGAGRLGWTHPAMARFLTGAGLRVLDSPTGLAPRALRDIRAGQQAGRFTALDADVALSAVAGGLLGLLRLCQDHPERIHEQVVDQLAEAILRLLGVPADEAARLAALPIPEQVGW